MLVLLRQISKCHQLKQQPGKGEPKSNLQILAQAFGIDSPHFHPHTYAPGTNREDAIAPSINHNDCIVVREDIDPLLAPAPPTNEHPLLAGSCIANDAREAGGTPIPTPHKSWSVSVESWIQGLECECEPMQFGWSK